MITETGILGSKKKILKGFSETNPVKPAFVNQKKIVINMNKKAALIGAAAGSMLKHNLRRGSVLLSGATGSLQGLNDKESPGISGAIKGGLKNMAIKSHVIPLGRGKGVTGGQLAYIKNRDNLRYQHADNINMSGKLKKKKRSLI